MSTPRPDPAKGRAGDRPTEPASVSALRGDAEASSGVPGGAPGAAPAGTLPPQRAALAARLRTARELAGLSQGQVARLMGLHRPSVSEAEAGRRRVSAEELAEFARHYGVNVGWLSGTEPETLDPADARVQLAARELSKLKADDLDRVLRLLAALRPSGA